MSQAINEFSRTLSPEIYRGLKRAVELGKWPDGRPLDAGQRELCLQAIISYEHAHVAEEDRTGYMEQACNSQSAAANRIDTLDIGDDR